MGCVNFNGTNSCILVSQSNMPIGNSPRTIELSFKTTSPSTSFQCLFSYGSLQAGKPLIFLAIQQGGTLYFESGSGNDKFISTNSYDDQQWHKLVFIVTGTKLKLYVDEVLLMDVSSTLDTSKQYPVHIGNYLQSNLYFYGYMDEIRVWNRELTETEIFTTYDTYLDGTESGLVFNYSFDSDDVSTIKDKTGNNNGTGYNLTYVKNDGIKFNMYLVKKDGKYYSIKSENYDTTNKTYTEINDINVSNFSTYAFRINELFNETTINDETFIPLDKFDNFSLISDGSFDVAINGIKTTSSMICTLEPISMKKYKTINKITGDCTIENNGAIKLIFSFDKGQTWKTYGVSNSVWNDVNVDIPIKLYENFTDEDKTNWNDATNTILSDGISVQNLDNVDFQSVKTDKLMFAVAFSRPSYGDTCTLKGLNINYDGLETYIQLACGSDLNKYEATISITGDSVEVKTASNQNKILVTMTTNI